MHLDRLPAKLAAYIRSHPELERAIAPELPVLEKTLETGGPDITELWVTDFLVRHRAERLPDATEIRRAFVSAAPPLFETSETLGLEAQQEKELMGDFRPGYVTPAPLPTLRIDIQAQEIGAAIRPLDESTRERILKDQLLNDPALFERVYGLKPATLATHHGIDTSTERIRSILDEADKSRKAFNHSLAIYPAKASTWRPERYLRKAIEPQLFAWGELLKNALVEFRAVEARLSHSGSTEQKQALGQQWIKFHLLRSDWHLNHPPAARAALLKTLQQTHEPWRVSESHDGGKSGV